jgi:23S rRNA pseudouridine1911/1915/1917 synthase
VDKPAGWLCHPLRAGERGTLANAVAARFPECAEAGVAPREGGLCHRLDRETSGLVLVARQREAFQSIRAQLDQGSLEKDYLALARGEAPDDGRCELPLGQRGNGPPRAQVDRMLRPAASARRPAEPSSSEPRDHRSVVPARTVFRTLARAHGFSWLEVRIETGARYQIRAHLAAMGLPLAGDAIYGGGEAPGALGRHLLHAARLAFDRPADGRRIEVRSPLPADAAAVIRALGLFGASEVTADR